MAEYKDIASLKEQIADIKKAIHSPNSDYLTGYLCALSVTEGVIAYLPAADVVEVVHARWEKIHDDPRVNKYRCTNCKAEKMRDNYCPNCGAKMDGGVVE